ncbi:MAG: MarR family transcriptional regulator [Desulfobacterales bacterium]|nr:MarR family transcriptional regulator [Desulfobacterales bacterium]
MQPDDRLIYLISRAQHGLMTYLKKELNAQGTSITPVQAGILFLLRKTALTMTRLSQILAIDNSAITGLVDRLEKAGLAERTTNPDDRRTYLIRITKKGKAEIDQAYVTIKKVNEEIKSGFSTDEIKTFKRVLNGLLDRFAKDVSGNPDKR